MATLLATRAPVVAVPGHAHRDVGAPGRPGQPGHSCAAGASHVVEPGVGRLAGGDSGAGRLAEPARHRRRPWTAALRPARPATWPGARSLVTAGGTREPIDAVRVITNRSSGKQGYAIAAEAPPGAASVILVTTVDRPAPAGVAEVVRVATAAEMEAAVVPRPPTPTSSSWPPPWPTSARRRRPTGKFKKDDGVPEIVLEPTHDFLVDLGRRKPRRPGAGRLRRRDRRRGANARRKLRSKHLDLIVANDVSAPGAGFEHDTNQVIILGADGSEERLPLTSKTRRSPGRPRRRRPPPPPQPKEQPREPRTPSPPNR